MFLKECDRCEEKFPLSKLIRNGGLYLCKQCSDYIEKEYPKSMAEEYNHEPTKCRGCDG